MASIGCGLVLGDRDEIVIDAPNEGYWREALARAVHIDLNDDPAAFFTALSERLNGTFVVATDPVEDGS